MSHDVLGWIMRFELTASRATIWRSNQLSYTHHCLLVEVKGLEPPAPWSQTKCATKLRYTSTLFIRLLKSIKFCLNLYGRGRGTRTPGARFWRPTLYQLSYTPMFKTVGHQGLEPRTYRL